MPSKSSKTPLLLRRPVDFGSSNANEKENPFSGHVFVFRGRRGDIIKELWFDGQGLCLFAKRLEDGIFRWPKIEDGVMRLSAAQLSALLEGLDWRLVHEARETPAPTQAG